MAAFTSLSVIVCAATILLLSFNPVRSQSCGPDEEAQCYAEFIDVLSQMYGLTSQEAMNLTHALLTQDRINPYGNRDEICRVTGRVDLVKFANCMDAYVETCASNTTANNVSMIRRKPEQNSPGTAARAPPSFTSPNHGKPETKHGGALHNASWEIKTEPLVDICHPGCDDGEELTNNAVRKCLSNTEKKMAGGVRPKCSEVQRDFDCAALMVKECPFAFKSVIHMSSRLMAQAAGPSCKVKTSHLLSNLTLTAAPNNSQRPESPMVDPALGFIVFLTATLAINSIYG